MVNYTILGVIQSIAYYLKEQFPDVNVYNNPTQQLVNLPCWFINLVPYSGTVKELSNRYVRTFNFDLVYREQYNESNLYDNYLNVADKIDEMLFINYKADGENYPIRTYDRNITVGLDALHYKFRIMVRVSKEEAEAPLMEIIEDLNIFVEEAPPEI